MPFDTLSSLDVIFLQAYLDPGQTSLQFQILVAGLLSASFFIKSYVLQAREFIGRIMKKGV